MRELGLRDAHHVRFWAFTEPKERSQQGFLVSTTPSRVSHMGLVKALGKIAQAPYCLEVAYL